MPAPLSRVITSNSFYTPARQWQVRVFVLKDETDAFEETLTDIAVTVSSFELDEEQLKWCVDAITLSLPDEHDIVSRLSLTAGLLGIETPAYELTEIESQDWVTKVQRSFAPISIGRFYVHGSHIESPPPKGMIALEVNAGAAFGSGEHATTSGCLLALSRLSKRRKFLRPLDMGCGSGILALAMAKLWHVPVVGVDIDPVSVRVSTQNAIDNRVAQFTHFAAGDGYNTYCVRHSKPFDIIVANILARPLVKMAPALAANLAPNGIAVLSGLLVTQERMVISAHRVQGLTLQSRIRQNGWSALILKK